MYEPITTASEFVEPEISIEKQLESLDELEKITLARIQEEKKLIAGMRPCPLCNLSVRLDGNDLYLCRTYYGALKQHPEVLTAENNGMVFGYRLHPIPCFPPYFNPARPMKVSKLLW